MCRLPEGGLGVGITDLLTERQIFRDIVNSPVQEGYAALEAVGHAHFIRLEQDIALQPEIEVNILHLLGIREGADLLVEGRRQGFRLRVRCRIFQDPVPLLHSENIGVSDEAVLHRPGSAHEEALALGMAGNL